MDLHSEHSGGDSYQNFSLSRGPSLIEASLSTLESKKKDDFKLTMAYEKGLMKERCGLCKMYFHRNSVNYKVPNHRIFELERQWKVKREGRRYANAGFLYKMIDVCSFCSQFFKIMPEELPTLGPKEPEPKPMKLEITTVVERTDIAKGQRVYASSSVDGRTADMAILMPYDKVSRTRREVDPWWEVDFSRSYHVHSLSFLISTGKHQQLTVSVFLLDKPYGFEDPFLDSMRTKAIASTTQVVPESDVPVMHAVNWTLEPNTTCFAIRVQLKGIHSLAIQKFQVFQGDNLVITTEDDFVQTLNSYSNLSPGAVRDGVLDMMSPEEKKIMIKENDPYIDVDERLKEKYVSVGTLAQQIKRRKHRIRMWKEKVQRIASIFPPEEIEGLYRVIFKPALEAKPSLKDAPPLLENELMDGALIQHFPRCDLTELHVRLRSIVRWIQTRSHLKILSTLATSHNFDVVANDPNAHLHYLQSAFKRVEAYWRACQLHEDAMMQNAKDLGFVGVKVAEARGCSWAQFLILMSLFCTRKCKQIPETAFYLDSMGSTSDVAHHTLHGLLPTSPGDDVSINSGSETNAMHSLSGGGSVSNHSMPSGKSEHHDKHWLERMSTPVKLNPPVVIVEPKTFLQKAREVEQFPYYNSSFAEYKFWHFQRRSMLQNIDFPPDLSLEFARSLNPRRGQTSQGLRLPAMENTLENTAGSVAGGSNAEGSHPADDASIHSGISGYTPPAPALGDGKSSRPNTRSSFIGTPSKKFRGPQAVGFEGSVRAGSPSTKFAAPPGSAKLAPAASSRNLLSSSMTSLEGALTRSLTLGQNSASLVRSSTSLTLVPNASSRPQTTGGMPNARALLKSPSKIPVSDEVDSFQGSDLLSFGDSDADKHQDRPQTVTIDFFRVCSLCELKFPRDCMEMKVMRKHVVQLRMSWDPKLVSKEIRLLDHTISMYSLVHVCTFCSQFFDPDFPDGIAYPVRVDSPVPKVKSALQAIATQGSAPPLQRHYDTRYLASPIEVGEVFSHPLSVESRARAHRAREIAQKHKERQAAILEASILNAKAAKANSK